MSEDIEDSAEAQECKTTWVVSGSTEPRPFHQSTEDNMFLLELSVNSLEVFVH